MRLMTYAPVTTLSYCGTEALTGTRSYGSPTRHETAVVLGCWGALGVGVCWVWQCWVLGSGTWSCGGVCRGVSGLGWGVLCVGVTVCWGGVTVVLGVGGVGWCVLCVLCVVCVVCWVLGVW